MSLYRKWLIVSLSHHRSMRRLLFTCWSVLWAHAFSMNYEQRKWKQQQQKTVETPQRWEKIRLKQNGSLGHHWIYCSQDNHKLEQNMGLEYKTDSRWNKVHFLGSLFRGFADDVQTTLFWGGRINVKKIVSNFCLSICLSLSLSHSWSASLPGLANLLSDL